MIWMKSLPLESPSGVTVFHTQSRVGTLVGVRLQFMLKHLAATAIVCQLCTYRGLLNFSYTLRNVAP